MAVSGRYKVAGQVEVDGYAKVVSVRGGKEGFEASVGIYASKEAADQAQIPLYSFSYTYPYVAGLDPLEAAYLKMPFAAMVLTNESPVLEAGQVAKETPEVFKPAAE